MTNKEYLLDMINVLDQFEAGLIRERIAMICEKTIETMDKDKWPDMIEGMKPHYKRAMTKALKAINGNELLGK